MLEGGENPLYIARRLIRFASEDVGMADSNALQVAVAAYQACHFLGMPECDVHLTHAVTYLAMAPKSNARIPKRTARILCILLLMAFAADIVFSLIHPNSGAGITDYQAKASLLQTAMCF